MVDDNLPSVFAGRWGACTSRRVQAGVGVWAGWNWDGMDGWGLATFLASHRRMGKEKREEKKKEPRQWVDWGGPDAGINISGKPPWWMNFLSSFLPSCDLLRPFNCQFRGGFESAISSNNVSLSSS